MDSVKTSTPWFNKNPIRIGPDEVRMKLINDLDTLNLEGIICNVGTDFVDVLQDDQTIVTVLTDRIMNIKWADPDCEPCCSLNHTDCRCDNHHDHCSHCHDHHVHCPHCDGHHEHCDCHHNRCCETPVIWVRDNVVPFCDDRIQLRLAGLTDSVNFELFSHKGCRVILGVS